MKGVHNNWCRIWFLAALFCCDSVVAAKAETPEFLRSAERILFLGDSITHAGHYICQLEAEWRLRRSGQAPEMINLGLPSETCSGLSEPDHPFPRPDVHERLQRALGKTKPDVVVACYGMNDGIYYPFSEERFSAYKNGIHRLIEKVHASGAKLILMSPPPFDPLPVRKQNKLQPLGVEKYAWFSIYENYDEVMARYAAWIMQQGDRVAMVVDLHTPANVFLQKKRTTNADFAFSTDGVHLDKAGHRVLATAILNAWGMGESQQTLSQETLSQKSTQMLELVEQRQHLLHNAWLSHVGHKRPDMSPGLPLVEAKRRARELEKAILALGN